MLKERKGGFRSVRMQVNHLIHNMFLADCQTASTTLSVTVRPTHTQDGYIVIAFAQVVMQEDQLWFAHALSYKMHSAKIPVRRDKLDDAFNSLPVA